MLRGPVLNKFLRLTSVFKLTRVSQNQKKMHVSFTKDDKILFVSAAIIWSLALL